MLDPTPTGLHSGATPLLSTSGLTKRYGSFLANDAIDIEIWPQQIHALLGENGAGKSTLIKILGGAYQPDRGRILLDGHEVEFSHPVASRRAASTRSRNASTSSSL